MPDARVPVPQVGVAHARSLQEEQVVCRPVIGDPEVPQPVVGKAERPPLVLTQPQDQRLFGVEHRHLQADPHEDLAGEDDSGRGPGW